MATTAADEQGQWNSQTSTPLERPLQGKLAGKESLSDGDLDSEEFVSSFSPDQPYQETDIVVVVRMRKPSAKSSLSNAPSIARPARPA